MRTSLFRTIAILMFVWGSGTALLVDAQALSAVQSRKTHAAFGIFDLPIDNTQPIGGAITVEPRAIGAGHKIVFQFNSLAIAPSSVTAVDPQNLPIGTTSFSVIGTEVTVTLIGVPDNSRVAVSLRNSAATVYATTSVGFLFGDVDGNGVINLADVTAVKVLSGSTVNATNFYYDVGVSGSIKASDISAVKTRLGKVLVPAGQAPITIILTGTGVGLVTTVPAGISCPTTCSANFPINTPLTFNVSTNVGSTFTSASGPCAATGMINITSATVCGAVFTADTFIVTPSAGTNGTISPLVPQTINYGAVATFTVSPNAGFATSMSGTCGGTLIGNTYTTSPVLGNCSVVASFLGMGVAITPSAGTNGVITPSTVQTVSIGATASFTVTPNANYTPVMGGTCGGSLVGSLYTTNVISAACTVSVNFVRNSYSVTPSAGTNGTISPSTPQLILNGATANFTVTPALGFSATVAGTCGGTLVGTTYTTNPITGLCSVIASFAAAAPKYVATTGDDTTGDGTIGKPWKTIGKGISMLTAGGTLIVKNGIYANKPNFISGVPSGTPAKYTMIMAETPMQVRIQSLTSLGVADNQLSLIGNYIAIDGFIFDMAGTTNPAFTGFISGNFNTISRSIFKRGGDIDAFGGLLEVTGSDTLIEDVAGSGACRYCFSQGGANATTQRNIWRRVVGRFDYSNSLQAKATFATQGNDSANGVTDHLYQNVIAIDGQNPGNLGGLEKFAGVYTPKNALNVTLQGSIVLNEGTSVAGIFMRDTSNTGSAINTVVWDLPTSPASAIGLQGGVASSLTIGGNVPGAAVDLLSAPSLSLLKPPVNPANMLNNTPGATIQKQYGVSGTHWGQTGYDQLTNVDLWPWPYQDRIKSVLAESNNVPAGSSPAMNNSLRGFTANGIALYGGPITLTSYVWEYLGTPCPSTACTTFAVTPSAGTNGTISPAVPVTVLPGTTTTFTITPAIGFQASVGGTCGGSLVGTTFTTNPVNGPCTVVALFSQGQTYFVSNSGNNSNSCAAAKSIGTPKQTIQAGFACLAPGDTLVIRDGTYSGAANAFSGLPNGASGNYITIAAENEGNVIITSGFDMSQSNVYIIIQGLRFQDANQKSILGQNLKFFRNEFKGAPMVGNVVTVSIGTNNAGPLTRFVLLEDNWVHGDGGRYKILVYNSDSIVLRRVVTRFDGFDTTNVAPEADVSVYDSSNVEVQNALAIDGITGALSTGYICAFYNPSNGTTSTLNVNRFWRGVMAIRPAGYLSAAEGQVTINNLQVEDAILFGGRYGVSQLSATNAQYRRITIVGTDGDGFGIFGGSATVQDSIVLNATGRAFNGITPSTSVAFGNANGNSGGTVIDPRTNGLLYLPRIETGSVLATGGTNGGQRGATIIKRIGQAGSLYGEMNYNTATASDLWPFPNEARIKKEMCADAGITRGFCASSGSITAYIFSILGTPSPYP